MAVNRFDFDNLTADDIRTITKEDINEFTSEQFIKYKDALDKYKRLLAVKTEPSLVHDLIGELSKLSSNFDSNTRLEISLIDECGRDICINTRHCSVKYDKGFNRVLISNYSK